jgi:NhaP-type Na+/H+ or K+/H+ antiporter
MKIKESTLCSLIGAAIEPTDQAAGIETVKRVLNIMFELGLVKGVFRG